MAKECRGHYSICARDLRGDGDSGWAVGGQDSRPDFVLDVAALADDIGRDPLTLIGHSLGGAITLQFAGVCPDRVKKIVSIEGLGPTLMASRPAHQRLEEWLAAMQKLDHRTPPRYPCI